MKIWKNKKFEKEHILYVNDHHVLQLFDDIKLLSVTKDWEMNNYFPDFWLFCLVFILDENGCGNWKLSWVVWFT